MSIPSRVFVDTGIFYAFADQDDRDHKTVSALLTQARNQKITLVTSNFIVAETHALILRHLGRPKAEQWLKNIHNIAHIERATSEDEEKARLIIYRYKDKDFSYTDAISFAIMERLHITEAFSLDEHFKQYGKFIVKPALQKRSRKQSRIS
jgi:predicted nucleic acid-binding protein